MHGSNAENMMPEIIFRCRTKATCREEGRLRFSLNWAFARRAKLVLTDKELVCGDWRIPYSEIEDASLVTVPTLFGPARNLMVRWRGRTYQFQLKSESLWRMVIHPFWDGPLPFQVHREVRSIEW
jgi:hypothetical protein